MKSLTWVEMLYVYIKTNYWLTFPMPTCHMWAVLQQINCRETISVVFESVSRTKYVTPLTLFSIVCMNSWLIHYTHLTWHQVTFSFAQRQIICEILTYPPHTLDLTPSDFFLCPKMNNLWNRDLSTTHTGLEVTLWNLDLSTGLDT